MNKTINGQRAIELLREAVAERGSDYVYVKMQHSNQCYYVHTKDEIGCLIGLALHKAGVPVGVLKLFNAVTITSREAQRALSENEWIISDLAYQVFSSAQRMQDSNGTWGNALHEAEETYIQNMSLEQ